MSRALLHACLLLAMLGEYAAAFPTSWQTQRKQHELDGLYCGSFGSLVKDGKINVRSHRKDLDISATVGGRELRCPRIGYSYDASKGPFVTLQDKDDCLANLMRAARMNGHPRVEFDAGKNTLKVSLGFVSVTFKSCKEPPREDYVKRQLHNKYLEWKDLKPSSRSRFVDWKVNRKSRQTKGQRFLPAAIYNFFQRRKDQKRYDRYLKGGYEAPWDFYDRVAAAEQEYEAAKNEMKATITGSSRHRQARLNLIAARQKLREGRHQRKIR